MAIPKTDIPAHTLVASRAPLTELFDYQVDLYQRAVLYLNTLPRRAEHMIEHKRAGKPPLLDFD